MNVKRSNTQIASIEDVRKYMNAFIKGQASDQQIIQQMLSIPFFTQLKGVDLSKSTKAKLYGNTIYMNGIALHLNQKEEDTVHNIIQEAERDFANYTDSDLKGIKNSLIIGSIFALHFPEYECKPNRFNPTVPYCLKQFQELL